MNEGRSRPALRGSALILWSAAPVLLLLGLVRPPAIGDEMAEGLPRALPGFELARDNPLTARQFDLLGTRDVVWRTYLDASREPVYLIAVFHAANWKSVHPPHICLRGSDMELREDRRLRAILGERQVDVGEIVAHSKTNGQGYLSWFVYGAQDFCSPSYAAFVWRHVPRALLRRADSGFLLRVETWIGMGGLAAARERCRALLAEVLPAAEARLP